MITNLFSIFDPSTNILNLYLNWIRSIISLLLIPPIFWINPSRLNFNWNQIIIKLFYEIKINLNSSYNKRILIFIALFTTILINNYLALFPYIFIGTRHLVFTIALALPIWLISIIYGWLINNQHILIHLIPQNTPSILILFIVCIETIRNLIRPTTLTIRLTANIIAGHLLINLLGETGSSITKYLIILLLIIQIILLTIEYAVSIIQSYVFTILRNLYSKEVIN